MTMYKYRAVANGLRTDHPIPDLPFVDDEHIPIDDPAAIEAVGRHHGSDMWGREDKVREGGWIAFTTDPIRHDLGWAVRWHPDHGRSVVLYRDEDTSPVHMTWWGPPLLFRAGGYWWDGSTWYRPSQIWDRASERHVQRPVPAAMTVTAADLLASGGDRSRGRVFKVAELNVDAPPAGRWLDDLARWAHRRTDSDLPLSSCVVQVTAPELSADQLVGVAEMAEIAGVAASTLRAYVSRGEGDVPLPQATMGGRNVWSRPVAEEWAEQRRRSSDGVSEPLATDRNGSSLPVGIAELWNRFSRSFLSQLWESPDRRKRWALRWRTEESVRDVAEGLSWEVAASLDRIVPMQALAITIRHALLDELAYGQALFRSVHNNEDGNSPFYGIKSEVAQMLDWLIRHKPSSAGHIVGEVVGEAEGRFGIPRDVTDHSIRTALSLDGKLEAQVMEEFMDRVVYSDADQRPTTVRDAESLDLDL